ncbi:MAG: hypothetical protein H6586_05150 [Flavobacteriales bacterium]|nr:hypothetical protein [Flavobacteriales bacterium]
MNKIFKLVLCFALIIPLVSSAQNGLMKKATVENGAIPENFGKEETIMIFIIKDRKSYDKYLKKNVEENYGGKYVYLLKEDLENKKYQDKNLYRYVMDYETHSSNMTTYNPGNSLNNANNGFQSTSVTGYSYSIYDRKEDKEYPSNVSSGLFGKLIKGYVINLEAERQKNSK